MEEKSNKRYQLELILWHMQRPLLPVVAFPSANKMNTIISSVNFNVSIYFVSSTDEGFAFVSQGMSKVLYSVLLSHCYCLSNDFQSFQMSTVQKPIPTYYSSQSQQEQAVAWTNQNSKQSVVTLSIHSMGKIACARCNWFLFLLSLFEKTDMRFYTIH